MASLLNTIGTEAEVGEGGAEKSNTLTLDTSREVSMALSGAGEGVVLTEGGVEVGPAGVGATEVGSTFTFLRNYDEKGCVRELVRVREGGELYNEKTTVAFENVRRRSTAARWRLRWSN